MNIQYPHTIQNCAGEKIIFQVVEPDDKVVLDAFCEPGCGPTMHTHFKQDESLTVVSGKMGYQCLGEEPKFAGPGETVLFTRGTPHKFWSEGNEVLHCKGWIQPVHSVVYFLSALYAAQNKSGSMRPEAFDGAYLTTRYAGEYDLPEIPGFVKKVIMPFTCFLGKILGKYGHFKDAPQPLK